MATSVGTAKLTGTEKVMAALKGFGAQMREAAAGALYREAERIMAASKARTPVLTGFLRASAFVELPKIAPTRVEVTLGYSANYSLFVHENLSARHTTGEAKFLEKSALEALPDMAERLAADLETKI